MEFIYPFLISFIIVFFSELGDKTQLLVLSFSTKDRAKNILFGVAIGTFFSHGMAILFGSKLASFQNETFQTFLQVFTYASFLFFGILGFVPEKEKKHSETPSFLKKIYNFRLNYIFVVALSIVFGELGDKTFLASMGLGLQYFSYKFSLILGCILGMVCSNSIALFFGKFLNTKFKPETIEFVSNLIFIIFGLAGFVDFFVNFFVINA